MTGKHCIRILRIYRDNRQRKRGDLSGSHCFKLGLYVFDLYADRDRYVESWAEQTFFRDIISCDGRHWDHRLCTVFQYFCKNRPVGACGPCGDGAGMRVSQSQHGLAALADVSSGAVFLGRIFLLLLCAADRLFYIQRGIPHGYEHLSRSGDPDL